jgi:hypothetical protein
MSVCAPQRYLANDRNLVRDAALTPSSVQSVADSVLEIPTGRVGSAQVALTGSYTGAEQALYEVEILDDTVSTKLVSVPIATGAGSGTLSNISATAAAQTFTIQLADAGIPTLRAGIDFEGVRIVARAEGASGNAISLTIDQSALVFTPQSFSLLEDLKAGDGGPTTGVKGSGLDWDTKVLSADNIIPANAHRVAFGDDTSAIYLQYKQYVDGEWIYHFVPALKRDVPKGSRVSFVTGGRTVRVTDGVTPETYTDVETLYDLLNDLKTTSVLTDVEGVVANDRSPTGQAARELLARTDAHVEPSTGSGSAAAQGFIDTFANENAATELVTATCFAVTADDHPLARLGAERWKLQGSVSGDLGEIVTGLPFTDPDGKFGLTIPVRLPDGFGVSKGRFSLVDIEYVPRDGGVDPFDVAALCPVALSLGPEATDGAIQLVYTKRPSGDCVCSKMPIPNLGGPCLGNATAGGETMGYRADTVGRLRAFYSWKADTVKKLTAVAEAFTSTIVEGGFAPSSSPGFSPESFNTVCASFESVLAQIDPLADGTVINPSAITVGATTVLTIPAQTSAPAVGSSALLQNFAGADAATINGKTVIITASTTTSISFTSPSTASLTITTNSGAATVTLFPERVNGVTEWDTAVAAFESDVDAVVGEVGAEVTATALESITQGAPVVVFPTGDTYRVVLMGHASVSAGGMYGFAKAAITSGAAGVVRLIGEADGLSSLTAGTTYYAYPSAGGVWTATAPTSPETPLMIAVAISTSKLDVYVNSSGNSPGNLAPLVGIDSARYESKLQHVLMCAGISPLGKADASILQSGDGCWRDYGDAFYWKVTGPKGAYAPAFNNHPYWSSRLADDGNGYFSTHEFAFQINCKCPEHLEVGDTINLSIGGSGWGATYTRGDVLTLPIVSAQPLQLAGGQDGNAILVWYVTGSVDGALPNFTYDPGSPAPYADGGLAFTYNPGGIANAKGDTFQFTIEGGHYQWRKDGGSWSSSTAIPSGPVSLDAGLSIEFTPGLYPSFVTGDMYRFTALQPWAVSNLQTPDKERWQWTGSSANLVVDLGSNQTVTMAAVARHTLPASATLLLEGGTSPGVYTWSQALTWNAEAIVAEFDAQTARYLRLTVGSASGGGIGWFWAGEPLTTSLSAEVLLRRSYKVEASSGGLDQGGKYLARARSGQVLWTEAALLDADVTGLAALLDWIKEHDDEPFCIVPNITIPEEAFMQRVAVDDVDFEELSAYNAAAGVRERRYTITMPLSGVWT